MSRVRLTLNLPLRGASCYDNAMTDSLHALQTELLTHYPAEQWPSLLHQVEQWSQTRPLAGLKVLDNTPLFRNTLAKFLGLLAAGAELYVLDRALQHGDVSAVKRAVQAGIHCISLDELKAMEQAGSPMDLVLDCNGEAASLHPNFGFVELTRSGVARYLTSTKPVLVADAGRIKLLETALGTSDGFFRAMAQLGYNNLSGKSLVVVGCGKVGLGVVVKAKALGMRVIAVDLGPCANLPQGVEFLLMEDREAVQSCMESAWCVVMVTGHASALEGRIDLAKLCASHALLANLGADDEFGDLVPTARLLGRRETMNFILDDPTAMPYIETTMALHSACAIELLGSKLAAGCHSPQESLEQELLEIVKTKGCLPATELEWIDQLWSEMN